jgi:hypothetical protein
VYRVSISPRRSATVTEAQVCRYLGNNLEAVKDQAKQYLCRQIDDLTAEELFDRFWDGRRKYGGTFDVESIACLQELRWEAQDSVLYFLLMKFQREQ